MHTSTEVPKFKVLTDREISLSISSYQTRKYQLANVPGIERTFNRMETLTDVLYQAKETSRQTQSDKLLPRRQTYINKLPNLSPEVPQIPPLLEQRLTLSGKCYPIYKISRLQCTTTCPANNRPPKPVATQKGHTTSRIQK